MDTEAQPTPSQESSPKIEESSSDPPGEITNGKEDVKTPRVTRQKRSRSRTPQKPKEKKKDDNGKSKKEEIPISPSNIDKNVNGHSEKNSEGSVIKDNKKTEEKEEKPKEQDVRNLRSSENKNNKTEEKKETPKKIDSLNNDVGNNKETVESEENKSGTPTKKNDKKEKTKQLISNEEVKKPSTKDASTLDSEMSSKNNDVSRSEGESVDMDPLILASDEPDPELQFDENSDLESGKGSPIQLRCKTRGSHTRNIPTPKTPKSTDSESEKNSVAPTPTPENLNDTNDSINIGDISTRAEVGSDVTRLDFAAHNSTITSEDNSYLNYSRDRSLRETLRSLSPRKTIRPINDAYRQRAFRNNQNKSDLNMPYSEEDSVDRVTGIKRKRSNTPEDRKKFKADATGFVSYLSSPLNNIKSKFIADSNSSTPKLTGYKDSRKNLHEDISYSEVVSEAPEKKNWCAIM